MANVMSAWYSTGLKDETLVGRSRHFRREDRDWTAPLTFPTFPTETPSDDEPEISIPVIPVVHLGGKLCFDAVRIKDLGINVVEGQLNPDAAKSDEEEEDAKASESSEPWNKEIMTAERQKSLYRVALTHDFSKEETASPRGLFNTRNMCFFNSVLQVLVHTTRFNSLLTDIIENTPLGGNEPNSAVLNALALFLYSYAHVGDTKRAMSGEEFYSVICNHSNFHVEVNRQEDAQEFLSDLLDVLETSFRNTPPTEEDKKDDLLGFKRQAVFNALNADADWREVGQKSRPVELQHAGKQDLENPIEELFGGRFKSVLTKAGSKPSVTTEPFQQIPVDISSPGVNTVQQAFAEVFAEEQLSLDGVPATKKLELERLPPVLIVHLKRFTFIRHGDTFEFGKISKPITIDESLSLKCDRRGVVRYTPIGVVYHHGLTATRGHYTADVKVRGQWYNIDDELVKPIRASEVVGFESSNGSGSRSTYMVFYQQVPANEV